MIGYLFGGLALLCGVLKGYCGKRSSGTLVLASNALAVNTLRMLALEHPNLSHGANLRAFCH